MSTKNLDPNNESKTDETGTPSRRRGIPLGRILLIAFGFYVGMAVLWVITNLQSEKARWHQSAAMDDYLDGDLPAAIAHIDDAIAESPEDPELYAKRAEYKAAANDLVGALADSERAVELAPDRPTLRFALVAILQKLDRHDEAVELAEATVELSRAIDKVMDAEDLPQVQAEYLHASCYNHVAYVRAVAGQTPEIALEEIDEAIKQEKRIWIMQGRPYKGPAPAFADTRGFILYQLEQHDAAKGELDTAVAQFERLYDEFYGEAGRAKKDMQDHHGSPLADLRELEHKRQSLAETVSVMRYHRGLVLEQLGETDQAEADFQRVRDLGFEPNEKLY